MNLFAKTLLRIARHQPFNRGPFRRRALHYLQRRTNGAIHADYRGVPFIFNLDNPTEQKALFGFYNNEEIDYLIERTRGQPANFVDLGANSGFYSQVFLFHAAPHSKLLAIEPNPAMRERIAANIQLIEDALRARQIEFAVESRAASDRDAELYLNLQSGAGAAHVEDRAGQHSIRIQTRKLRDLLEEHGFTRIDLLKVDIEGHEDRALLPFFDDAPPALYPQSIIIEHSSDQSWQGDLWGKLRSLGYREILRTRGNAILELERR